MAAASSQMPPGTPGHQRSKSAFRTFMKHRRNNSDGTVLASAALDASTNLSATPHNGGSAPLGETSHNRQQEPSLSSLSGKRDMTSNNNSHKPEISSPTKKKRLARQPSDLSKDSDKRRSKSDRPGRSVSPSKKFSNRSTTNLVGLLSRPKSFRNMHKMVVEAEQKPERGRESEKKDRTPHSSVANGNASQAPPPIYAHFCTDGKGSTGSADGAKVPVGNLAIADKQSPMKSRPKSCHPSSSAAFNSSSTPASPADPAIDPKDIDTHLEALLDRRNIPENQRYKMRSLADTIKMEFIRQDWAEQRVKRPISNDSTRTAAQTPTVPSSSSSASSASAGAPDDGSRKAPKSKHSRVKSLTFSRTRGRSSERDSANSSSRRKSPSSPRKKKTEGTLGRHLRSKSTESVVSVSGGDSNSASASPTTSTAGGGNAITGFFSKSKGPQQHSPLDFVTYLRTVQKPEVVEVGKLHKLRLLLRNETVAWIEEFIGEGGMEEIVGLLHRILAVEWREEHEDALLHENLLCLKALCTTGMALQYLHAIHDSLMPAMIHMIFDPEKKGPSEFTTRNIVTSVLLTYIQSAPISERPSRAQIVLGYLRDPEEKEDERPVSFVLEMRRERPYRVWCKEVVSVTKEVFWIFLHHLNVIALPNERNLSQAIGNGIPTAPAAEKDKAVSSSQQPPLPPAHMDQSAAYMLRHFPQERPPVPAAPYVGGVEWEATNYLASHLDLVNAILACTPTAAERNQLRGLMEMSGWERCMGGSLRLCKEKFYGAVHDALRTWVAAAHEDGWDARSVRYGPPPPPSSQSERSSPKKKTQAAGGPKTDEPVPKIEIPKLDFAFDGEEGL